MLAQHAFLFPLWLSRLLETLASVFTEVIVEFGALAQGIAAPVSRSGGSYSQWCLPSSLQITLLLQSSL